MGDSEGLDALAGSGRAGRQPEEKNNDPAAKVQGQPTWVCLTCRALARATRERRVWHAFSATIIPATYLTVSHSNGEQ